MRKHFYYNLKKIQNKKLKEEEEEKNRDLKRIQVFLCFFSLPGLCLCGREKENKSSNNSGEKHKKN